MHLQHLTMSIGNLSCGGGGSLTIERALKKTDGVTRVYVNPALEMAYIEYDPDRIDVDRICEIVAQLGFEVGSPAWTASGRRGLIDEASVQNTEVNQQSRNRWS